MTEFRDYSTYLQRIVHLEKIAHEQCNLKKYAEARATVNQIQTEAQNLSQWLEEYHGT